MFYDQKKFSSSPEPDSLATALSRQQDNAPD
jgi:hypothetical protein